MSDEREMLAEVLAEHVSEQLWKPGGWVGDTACSCGWRMAMWSRKDFPEVHRKHVADALLASPQVARLIAAAKGEALREAADELNTTDHATETALSGVDHVIDWLRERAALTAEPAPTEGEGA